MWHCSLTPCRSLLSGAITRTGGRNVPISLPRYLASPCSHRRERATPNIGIYTPDIERVRVHIRVRSHTEKSCRNSHHACTGAQKSRPPTRPETYPKPGRKISLFLKIKVSNVLSNTMWNQKKNNERNEKTP